MECKINCGGCTYNDNMVNLCLDRDTRELLLNLIKDEIIIEFQTYEFLYDKDVDTELKNFIAQSVRTAINCILPDKEDELC